MASKRDPGTDALRTLAILAMMAAHTSRMIVFEARPAWCRWVLLLEPLIPSLFLFLVGLSLTHSLSRASDPKAWYHRHARRAVILWFISSLFFVLELGLRLPDMFVASGILSCIAYAILLTAAALLALRPGGALLALLAAGATAFVYLDHNAVRAFPWNIGNAPVFPLVLFTLAGGLWGLLWRRRPGWLPAIGVLAGAAALWMLHRYGVDALFTKPFGRSDAARLLAPPFNGGEERFANFYNLRPVLALFCVCAHAALLGIPGKLLARLPEKASRWIFAVGRHSLEAYVLHLTLLAALVVHGGPKPLNTAFQGNMTLLGVFLAVLGWSLFRESRRRPQNIDTSR